MKHENTRGPPFSYDTKMAADTELLGAQIINTEKTRVQSEVTIFSFEGWLSKHGREPTRVSGNAHW